jgi:hypothetical protein
MVAVIPADGLDLIHILLRAETADVYCRVQNDISQEVPDAVGL